MYYTIYKTTNLINNKIYIGLHQATNPYDSYLGSGKLLKKAIKKYGKQNFNKEVLHIFLSRKEMVNMEKELVNKDFINRSDTYNLNLGGIAISKLCGEKFKQAILKMKTTLKNKDLIEVSKKRINTMVKLYGDNVFKDIGIKSSRKQKENYKNGYINPNTNLNDIHIFNANNVLKYTCKRQNFKELCSKHGLPERVLIKSLQKNGIPIYNSQRSKNIHFNKYKDWYALYSNKTRIDIKEYTKNKKEQKTRLKELKSKTSVFRNPNNRGKKLPYYYEIYNKEGELVHSFKANLKEKLKELNLPVNTFTYAFRKNIKIKKNDYEGWTIIKK